MLELDLRRDTPEEYEGRLVSIDGGEYRIGSFLGEGVTCITHSLVNIKSGLDLLVIKIIKNQPVANTISKPALDLSELEAVPNHRLLELHGGTFQIADKVAGEYEAPADARALLKRGDLLLRGGNLEAARDVYLGILSRYPVDIPMMSWYSTTSDGRWRAWDRRVRHSLAY